MKDFKILFSMFIVLLFVGCKITKEQKMGNVLPTSFEYKTGFKTLKTLIIIPAEMDGIKKNFLFDTGAELTTIQRDSVIGKGSLINSPSGRATNSGSEIVKSLKIGNIDFINTFAVNTNMSGVSEQLPDFGGVIGQSIINKANWLIDYPKKTIEISSQDLSDSKFITLRLEKENNVPYTYVSVDGKEVKAIIDFGSSTEFTLTTESELAKYLLSKYNFENIERERSSIGATEKVFEKVANIPLVKLGEIEFEDVKVTIGDSKKIRIGISFFEDYQILIDNTNNSYKIKK
jgi:hypothetical protein